MSLYCLYILFLWWRDYFLRHFVSQFSCQLTARSVSGPKIMAHDLQATDLLTIFCCCLCHFTFYLAEEVMPTYLRITFLISCAISVKCYFRLSLSLLPKEDIRQLWDCHLRVASRNAVPSSLSTQGWAIPLEANSAATYLTRCSHKWPVALLYFSKRW